MINVASEKRKRSKSVLGLAYARSCKAGITGRTRCQRHRHADREQVRELGCTRRMKRSRHDGQGHGGCEPGMSIPTLDVMPRCVRRFGSPGARNRARQRHGKHCQSGKVQDMGRAFAPWHRHAPNVPPDIADWRVPSGTHELDAAPR